MLKEFMEKTEVESLPKLSLTVSDTRNRVDYLIDQMSLETYVLLLKMFEVSVSFLHISDI